MTQATTTPSTLTIGIDLGDRKSHVCVLDAARKIVEESRIASTPIALRARFEGLAPTRIALEVGTHSAWMSELLSELGHDVIVANPRKLRMIYHNDSKNDRVDAEQLSALPGRPAHAGHGPRKRAGGRHGCARVPTPAPPLQVRHGISAISPPCGSPS
jgi:transposase